ncbi:MAB_1171c family putative transporter [Streptomyces sp. NPDC004752]
MIYQVFAWCCALGALAAFLYKVPGLVRARLDPARIALCTYFLATCLCFAMGLEPVRSLAAALVGLPGATFLLVQAMVVVLTAAQQVVLAHWSDPPARAARRARRRILGYGISLIALGVAFIALGLPRHEVSDDADVLRNMGDPYYAVPYMAHLVLYAVGQFEAGRRCLHYARIAGRPWLSRGMWAVTAGSVCTLCYCVTRSVETLHSWLGSTSPWNSSWWITGSLGPLLQIFGWTVPSWGPRVIAGHRCVVAYLSYLRLRPLWDALYRATPGIALEPPQSLLVDLLPRRGLRYRLYRRVIEIRDGQLSLRPHLAQADEALVAGKDLTDITAAHEAAVLMAGLRARGSDSVAIVAPAERDAALAQRHDLAAETEWLTQVARAFRRLERQPWHGALVRGPVPSLPSGGRTS